MSPLIDSDDMKATLGVISAIKKDKPVADCIESGSTLRFMIPVAAALGKTVKFVGRGKLPERPIGDYLRLLPEHGVKCDCTGTLPLTISGQLTPGRFEIAGDVSSQYITGLLLALPILDGDSEIVFTTELQSKPYVDMTVKVMADFGVKVEERENSYFVAGNQTYQKRDYLIEADWSQAAFFMVAGALFGEVTLTGLDAESVQGDKGISDILKRFGADISVCDDGIVVRKSQLHGIEIDAANIPDMVPSLAVAGAYADGKTVIKGAERLRYKESDRIKSIVYNLKKMGADVKETADGMEIVGGQLHSANMKGFNDHRIVMAMTVAATGVDGLSTIDDAQSIKKSYPEFFNDFNSIGGNVNVFIDR